MVVYHVPRNDRQTSPRASAKNHASRGRIWFKSCVLPRFRFRWDSGAIPDSGARQSRGDPAARCSWLGSKFEYKVLLVGGLRGKLNFNLKGRRRSRRFKRDGDDVDPARADTGARSQGSETSVLAVRGDELSNSRCRILFSGLERGPTDAQLGRLSQEIGLGSRHPADGLLPRKTFFDF